MSNIVKSKIIAIKSNEVYEDFFNNLKKYPFIINNFNITEIQFNLRKITFLNLIKTLNHAKFFLQINQVFIFYLIQKNFQYRINFNYILKQIEKIRLKNKKAYKIKARKKIARFKR